MAQELEKLNYIWDWYSSDEIHSRENDRWIPDKASAFARINSFDFKAAKRREVRAVARAKIEEASPPDQQLQAIAEALRAIRRQQEGQALTPTQKGKVDAFINLEDATVAPIRARAKALITQVDALPNWEDVAEFDVETNW